MAIIPKKKISEIKQDLLNPILTSHFYVSIPLPESVKSSSAFDLAKLNLLCCETSLPGSSLATAEINNDYTGVTERHVHRRIYDDRIDLTFYVNAENHLPIAVFESWMKYIVGENVNRDPQMRGNVVSNSDNYFYRVRYPDSYVSSGLSITSFSRDYKNTLEYVFVRSYPISIGSIPVSYEASNLLKCTVSMTYIRYFIRQRSSAASIVEPAPVRITEAASFNGNQAPTPPSQTSSILPPPPEEDNDRPFERPVGPNDSLPPPPIF